MSQSVMQLSRIHPRNMASLANPTLLEPAIAAIVGSMWPAKPQGASAIDLSFVALGG